MNRNPTECGNVLILILIAIALIGILTMTVMRSSVTDADAVAPEQARIVATQVLSQARGLEQAVKNLLNQGCSEQTLNFDNPIVAGYANGAAPSDDSCDVFNSKGGGLLWPTPPSQANDGSDWRILAGNAVGGVTLTDDGACASGCIDPMIVLPNVTLAVCQQLNILSGVTTEITTPPVDAGDVDGTTKFVGVSAAGIGTAVLDAGNVLNAHPTGCFEATTVDSVAAAGTYWFYHVLIVR